VVVRWRTTDAEVTRRATTDRAGRFLVCDLPDGTPVRVAVDRGDPRTADALAAWVDGRWQAPYVRLAVPAVVPGTTTLAGVVVDHAGEPLTGAQVQVASVARLADAPRTAVTDATGAFQIADLIPGPHLVDFTHPTLDLYGVPSTPTAVSLAPGAAGASVRLAVPPADRVRLAVCGTADSTSGTSSLVIGRVSGDGSPSGEAAVAAGTRVRAVWDGGARQVSAAVGADGVFRLCHVPRGVAGTLVAEAPDARRSAPVPLEAVGDPGAELRVRHLVLHRAGSVTLAGRVRAPDGRAVAGARVRVLGAGGDTTASATTSDADGRFVLRGLSPDAYTVEAAAIGHAPVRATLRAGLAAGDTAVLTLGERAATLAAVRVTAGAADAFLRQRRVAAVRGDFLDATRLARQGPVPIGQVLNGFGRLVARAGGGTSARELYLERRGIACRPSVWVDGSPQLNGSLDALEAFVQTGQLAAVEVYPDVNATPAEYRAPGTICGAVVLWTREGAARAAALTARGR
jgi:hypothetical protein